MATPPRGPPAFIHTLRERSFPRLAKMLRENRGFGRTVTRNTVGLVNQQKTPVTKAIKLAYLASHISDHLVQAEEQASRIINKKTLTEQEQTTVWEKSYADTVAHLLRKINQASEVETALIERIDRIVKIPAFLHSERSKRWPRIERLHGITTDSQLLSKIASVLKSKRSPHAKAEEICFTAAMLADKLSWRTHNKVWEKAYMDIMLLLYADLSKQPDVVEAITLLK